jgi:hypothetical protein
VYLGIIALEAEMSLLSASYWVLAWLILPPWRWMFLRNILSRVRGSVTNDKCFWIGRLDLLALLLQLHLIILTYNNSQSVTTSGSFRFLLDYKRLPFHSGWLINWLLRLSNSLIY